MTLISVRAVAVLALALCMAAIPVGPGQAADAAVTIDNFTFDPPRLTVQVGTTVTWENRDDSPHTVVASTKGFRSKVLDTDERFSFTFTAPGTYQYFCSLHPHMTGTIVVEGMREGGGG